MFERGCLESHTAKLTRPDAAKLLGNIWRIFFRSPSWPSSYNVPDRASRTRRKRHRVRVGLFKDALQAKEPTKRIYEGCARLRRTLFFVSWCCGVAAWRSDNGYNCFHGLEQTHSFARRARDHARIYRGEYSVASIINIERIRKKKLKKHRLSLTKLRRLLSVCWKLNSIRIQQQQQQQQQRDSPY